jgi:hypothetical protein
VQTARGGGPVLRCGEGLLGSFWPLPQKVLPGLGGPSAEIELELRSGKDITENACEAASYILGGRKAGKRAVGLLKRLDVLRQPIGNGAMVHGSPSGLLCQVCQRVLHGRLLARHLEDAHDGEHLVDR